MNNELKRISGLDWDELTAILVTFALLVAGFFLLRGRILQPVSSATHSPAANTLSEAEGIAQLQNRPIITSQKPSLREGFVRLEGTGAPRSRVELISNGDSLGSARVKPDGTWGFETNGITSDQSNLIAVPKGENPSAAHMLEILAIDGGPYSYEEITVSGTANPNDWVKLIFNGAELAELEPTEEGSWSFSGYFPAGTHLFIAQEVGDSAAGAQSQTVSLELDTQNEIIFLGPSGEGGVRLFETDEANLSEAEGIPFEVYNEQEQLVQTGKVNGQGVDLPPGLYEVRFESDGLKSIKNVVVIANRLTRIGLSADG